MSKKIAIIFSVIALVWSWLYISKLTAKQIEKAYRVQENMYNQARQNMQLGVMFGVTNATICGIVNHKQWIRQ